MNTFTSTSFTRMAMKLVRRVLRGHVCSELYFVRDRSGPTSGIWFGIIRLSWPSAFPRQWTRMLDQNYWQLKREWEILLQEGLVLQELVKIWYARIWQMREWCILGYEQECLAFFWTFFLKKGFNGLDFAPIETSRIGFTILSRNAFLNIFPRRAEKTFLRMRLGTLQMRDT